MLWHSTHHWILCILLSHSCDVTVLISGVQMGGVGFLSIVVTPLPPLFLSIYFGSHNLQSLQLTTFAIDRGDCYMCICIVFAESCSSHALSAVLSLVFQPPSSPPTTDPQVLGSICEHI